MRRIAGVCLIALFLAGCGRSKLPGVYAVDMSAGCAWWVFTEESYVGEWAIALACPGVDLLRVYPWPPVQNWNETPQGHPPPPPAPTWKTPIL